MYRASQDCESTKTTYSGGADLQKKTNAVDEQMKTKKMVIQPVSPEPQI